MQCPVILIKHLFWSDDFGLTYGMEAFLDRVPPVANAERHRPSGLWPSEKRLQAPVADEGMVTTLIGIYWTRIVKTDATCGIVMMLREQIGGNTGMRGKAKDGGWCVRHL